MFEVNVKYVMEKNEEKEEDQPRVFLLDTGNFGYLIVGITKNTDNRGNLMVGCSHSA